MHEEDWKQYRRYRRNFWIVFVGYVPVISVAAILSSWLFHSFKFAFVLALAYMLLFIIAGIRVSSFYCPRCANWFAGKWWYNLGFLARKLSALRPAEVWYGSRFSDGLQPLPGVGLLKSKQTSSLSSSLTFSNAFSRSMMRVYRSPDRWAMVFHKSIMMLSPSTA